VRKLVWQMMVSLDGYHEGPDGDLSWHVTGEEFAQFVEEMLDSIGGIILGRKTYELFADFWPTSTEPEAKAMNELPKVVFSRTLDKVEWNNSRLVKDDVAGEVSRLKQEPGKELRVFGSANLASTLLREGLIDEYQHWANPVVLGAGTSLFRNTDDRRSMRLVGTQTQKTGVVVLTYKPL
jgi:dihydrofolate reductase